jgi:alcohol dehydrogenase class IV
MRPEDRLLAMLPRMSFPGAVYFGRSSLMYFRAIDKAKCFALVSGKTLGKNRERMGFLEGCTVREWSGEPRKADIGGMRKEVQGFRSVIGVGGGSVMDLAKAVRPEEASLVLVPTTPGTGSEVSRYAVMVNESGDKEAIVSEGLLPDAIVLDPSLLLSLPPLETIYTSIDMLAHSLEGLASRMSSALTDSLAITAIDLGLPALEKALEDPGDIGSRESLQVAGLLSGLVQSSASVGLVHSFAHYFGPRLGIPHGAAVGVFLRPVLEMNMKKSGSYAKLERSCLGSDILERLWGIMERKEMKGFLEGLDLSAEDEGKAAERIRSDVCTRTNPFMPGLEEIEGIIRSLSHAKDR